MFENHWVSHSHRHRQNPAQIWRCLANSCKNGNDSIVINLGELLKWLLPTVDYLSWLIEIRAEEKGAYPGKSWWAVLLIPWERERGQWKRDWGDEDGTTDISSWKVGLCNFVCLIQHPLILNICERLLTCKKRSFYQI